MAGERDGGKAGMQQQHVIDWWRHRGYRVTVCSDWSLMCVKESVLLAADADLLLDAIHRRHSAKWGRLSPALR